MLDIDQRLIDGAARVTSDRGQQNQVFTETALDSEILFDQRNDIIVVPVITASSCRQLIEVAESRNEFRPRKSDGLYAAPELLLRDIDSTAEMELVDGLVRFLNPLLWDFWKIFVRQFSPPFLIRYDENGHRGMPGHHDFQSDVSLSISLNSGFEGGGLYFPRQQLFLEHKVPGAAVVFPGKVTHLHSALPVTRGRRYVLTVWCRHLEESGGVP